MATRHIGAAGELLVQYQLLKHNVDSARMTTDAGVDLVVYTPASERARTIQVKTITKAGPAGGKAGGAPVIGWYFPHDLRAELLATVLLETDSVWLFSKHEAHDWARQHSAKDMRQLYWFTDRDRVSRGGWHTDLMDFFRLDNRVHDLILGKRARGSRPLPP
jgi:hypothetical protein